MLEMSIFKSLYSGQFTLSTQLIKPNYLLSVVALPLQQDKAIIQIDCMSVIDSSNSAADIIHSESNKFFILL